MFKYKYLYRSKINGIKIRTDVKLDPDKYLLVSEYKNIKMSSNDMILK